MYRDLEYGDFFFNRQQFEIYIYIYIYQKN